MKILLICKGEYRYFFPHIARALKTLHGCEVSAVASTSPAARMLRKAGAFEHVFNLAAFLKRTVPHSNLDECLASLQTMECGGDSPSLNVMLHADRILNRYPFDLAIRFLAALGTFWADILSKLRPDAILGEVACAAEWMACSLAQPLGIHYLIPYPTPIARRCFFLASPEGVWEPMRRQFEASREEGLSFEQTQIAEEFISDFRAHKRKPPFLSWAERSPLIPDVHALGRRALRIPFRLQTFLEDGSWEIGSHHGKPPWQPVWEDALRLGRHTISEALIFDTKIAAGPKVYFPLHVQPEFTTDVRAPFFTNQLALIEYISKSVPIGYCVIAKEHPGMKGERLLGYYREIKTLGNVQLLSPSVDSHEIIQQSDAVLTITGSSAWEAILYEKPAIAFGPVCYGFGDLVYRCPNASDLPSLLRTAIQNARPNHDELLRLVWSVLTSAYEFEWADPIRNPGITLGANAAKIADAILSEISSRAFLRTTESLPV